MGRMSQHDFSIPRRGKIVLILFVSVRFVAWCHMGLADSYLDPALDIFAPSSVDTVLACCESHYNFSVMTLIPQPL